MPELQVDIAEHVMVLTINRPERRNAVNATVATGLGEALERAEADTSVRAVVLTGAGEQAFCAGADLRELAAGNSIAPEGHPEWGFAGLVNHPVSVPLIAAVNGAALGGGTELTLACDLAVASTAARFGLPEVHRGIMAAGGGAVRLSQALPPKVAMRMLLTGEPIEAERAAELHLVNEVVQPERLLETAHDLAARVAAGAPLAVRATKRVARAITDGTFAQERLGWELNAAEIARLRESADASEGPRAFAEKRAPRWEGR